MQQIAEYVAGKYNISLEDLNSKSRLQEIVECRQMAWYLIRAIYKDKYSDAKIGYHFGRRSNSNIWKGVARLTEICEVDKNLKRRRDFYLSELLKMIGQPQPKAIPKKLLMEERIKQLEDKVKQLEFYIQHH